MPSLTTTRIYLAVKKREDRSHIEDQLVLDHADVASFASARDLWERIHGQPPRFIITDRRFGDEFDGLDLVRRVRNEFTLPYIYVLMRSSMDRIKEIQEGLDAGVDGYLIKPHNPFQIRSQVMVGMRWLTYIDSITWKDRGETKVATGK